MSSAINKREVFLRLAEKRTVAVMERIRILSNCSNRYAYEYSEEDVQKMFSAIQHELKAARAKFTESRRESFRLRSG